MGRAASPTAQKTRGELSVGGRYALAVRYAILLLRMVISESGGCSYIKWLSATPLGSPKTKSTSKVW